MIKCKIFIIDVDFYNLSEGDINAWLNTHSNIKVVEIKQSRAASTRTVVTLWYTDGE